jgi:hypothetical protein
MERGKGGTNLPRLPPSPASLASLASLANPQSHCPSPASPASLASPPQGLAHRQTAAQSPLAHSQISSPQSLHRLPCHPPPLLLLLLLPQPPVLRHHRPRPLRGGVLALLRGPEARPPACDAAPAPAVRDRIMLLMDDCPAAPGHVARAIVLLAMAHAMLQCPKNGMRAVRGCAINGCAKDNAVSRGCRAHHHTVSWCSGYRSGVIKVVPRACVPRIPAAIYGCSARGGAKHKAGVKKLPGPSCLRSSDSNLRACRLRHRQTRLPPPPQTG